MVHSAAEAYGTPVSSLSSVGASGALATGGAAQPPVPPIVLQQLAKNPGLVNLAHSYAYHKGQLVRASVLAWLFAVMAWWKCLYACQSYMLKDPAITKVLFSL